MPVIRADMGIERKWVQIPDRQKKKTLQVSRWAIMHLYRFHYSASAHQIIIKIFFTKALLKLKLQSVLCVTPIVPAEKLRKWCRLWRSKFSNPVTPALPQGNIHTPARRGRSSVSEWPHPALRLQQHLNAWRTGQSDTCQLWPNKGQRLQ